MSGQTITLTGLDPFDIQQLITAYHQSDFRFSRAWLCFVQENPHGSIVTNHSFLKFDFVDSSGSVWRGVKLEVRKDEANPVPDESRTHGDVLLDLKPYRGPPDYAKYSIELSARFTPMCTVGNLISLLAEQNLTSFEFSSTLASTGDNVIVGCRDFV